jgi:hypothetical protein
MLAVFMLPAIAPIARGAVTGVNTAGPPGTGREHAEALGLSPRGQPSPSGHRLAGTWQAPRRRCQAQQERKTS